LPGRGRGYGGVRQSTRHRGAPADQHVEKHRNENPARQRAPPSSPRHENDMSHQQFFRAAAAGALSLICLSLGLNAGASEHANKDEAVAMVKKGVSFWKANGDDKTFAAITEKGSQFHDRDLYLVVYGLDGTVHAHGANEKMVGRNLIEQKDIDGKPFVKERVEMAQKQPTFWQDYKFTDPVSKKIEPKQMYCERVDNNVLCGGVYKQ
jgi:cytochrome c